MAKKKALSRDQLTQGPDLERVEVEKLGGGGVVYVRPLPLSLGFKIWRGQENGAGEADEGQRNQEMVADFVTYGVVDEDGNRILSDDDRDVVLNWPIGDAQAIADAVRRVSGMEGEVTAEDIEGN